MTDPHIQGTLDHLEAVASEIVSAAGAGLITRTEAALMLADRYVETARWIGLYEEHGPHDDASHPRRHP